MTEDAEKKFTLIAYKESSNPCRCHCGCSGYSYYGSDLQVQHGLTRAEIVEQIARYQAIVCGHGENKYGFMIFASPLVFTDGVDNVWAPEPNWDDDEGWDRAEREKADGTAMMVEAAKQAITIRKQHEAAAAQRELNRRKAAEEAERKRLEVAERAEFERLNKKYGDNK